ncbi:DUF1016 N-terminal domain-containing protein [uncultured Eubacterium sp.]|uniref:DUF1016 N-terminal domain-containing protein n=1 Tax=uncultured Eubacterium sp. TaxID=165185 RepID=UPI0032675D62
MHYARNAIVKHVNIVQIMTYYSLGRWIVETQQMGQKRAKYGSKVIKILSEKLQEEFGKGFSEDTLKNARKFYLTYKERISETVFSLFEKEPPFIVSRSHYLQLMRIENEDERSFYEIESAKSGWAVRTLQRQYNSSLYERLALSWDKNGVLRLEKEGNVIEKPEDIIKQKMEKLLLKKRLFIKKLALAVNKSLIDSQKPAIDDKKTAVDRIKL